MSIADRTVISIFPNHNDTMSFRLIGTPGQFPGRGTAHPLDCNYMQEPFKLLTDGVVDPDVVRSVGARLYSQLEGHPAFQAIMGVVLARLQNQIAPIYLQLDSDAAEMLPWEALHANGSFLALDPRWPVGRITEAITGSPIDRTFEEPLTVVVVLAAAQNSAALEWEALLGAFRQTTIRTYMHVYVCEDELAERIKAANDIPAHLLVNVQFLSGKDELIKALHECYPHIVHFFCHGSSEGAILQLATRADWTAENEVGSIAIQPQELMSAATLNPNIWLLTLNCCEGAAVAVAADGAAPKPKDIHSMAKSLASLGFPAVIGMREAVATVDAHRFAQALYLAILAEVASCIQAGACEIEWVKVLQAPRRQLCELRHPGRVLGEAAVACKEWTLPIMYLRPEPFKLIRGRPTKPGLDPGKRQILTTKLNELRRQKAGLAELGVPQAALDEIQKLIDNTEQELYV